jgi:HK97 family phage portal protein
LTASGGWAGLADRAEDRALPSLDVRPAYPSLTTSAPLNVTLANALTVSDAYACVRVLADSISSLPLHVYRRTEQGRVPAGDNSRAVQLLQRPSPGSTGVDLISHVMTTLALHGECFIGKFRSGDGEIAQLVLISPGSIQVELRGQRIVYLLDTIKGRTEHGPEDILHIKGMSSDGLRGLSPITQCRTALGLSSSLQQSAKVFTEQGSRPSGVLTVPSTTNYDALTRIRETWAYRHAGVAKQHQVAVVSGDVKFTPVALSADDSQFLQQRELSAREIARIFRVPAWVIDAPTGDSLTYANVAEQNRALATHSLRPWATRIERAISNDADLCPGGTYVQFDFDGLLRASPEARAQQYTAALDPVTGWMTRPEVRELEDLPPETAPPEPPPAAPPPAEETNA